MWVCLNSGFISIVHKDCKSDELMVRARRKGDIEKVFPGVIGKKTQGTDYAFRAVVSREAVAQMLTDQVFNMDYSNFKNSVWDNALHSVYSSVWSIIGRLQDGGPYGNTRTNKRQSTFFDYDS